MEFPHSVQYVLTCPELVIIECRGTNQCIELYRQKEKEVKKVKI
ncbi:hypothetical protein [Acidianus bottle-shaped virus 3 strain ABV3]|uniref:Uncharacterized protein n=1 Tax=Acidianus bottle-shaped virus 3 strain ABV3 TaxID=1732174 RepID=A0A0N9NI76_9VIRU|nr:hypothetical protein AVU00_gp28 [Acidianus bottle-shaped virus 3 strain ABV3]ALG96830.1 hypothetical protein [Acidianus bottle-shaped virus 3 strain ABV3]